MELKKIYLAIPYSGMEKSSYDQANRATVAILNEGYNVFSPITHSHPLAQLGTPGTWEFWSKIDYQFLDWADEVWVLIPDEGIKKVMDSTGVNAEMHYAQASDMPIRYVALLNGKLTFPDEVKVEEIL